jgi:hypothetical protein
LLQKIPEPVMSFQQGLDPLTQFLVPAAGALQKRGAFPGRPPDGLGKNLHVTIGGIVHKMLGNVTASWPNIEINRAAGR